MRDVSISLVAFSAVLLGATWIGYPVWLRLRAGSFPRFTPAGSHARWPTVTIVVIVRNAEVTLRQLLNNLLALAYPADLRRILVVSNASTDFTDAVAGLFAHHGVDLLRIMRPAHAGVENYARQYAHSEVVVRVHPTARLRPWALAALVAPFADTSVGVAYGREIAPDLDGDDPRTGESPYRRFEGWLRDLETRVFGTVSARGSMYAVRSALYRAPVPGGLSADFSEMLTAREHGYRAVYVRDAACVVTRERSLRGNYARTVQAVARDVATLLFKRHLLNPRRYGEFAWMLLGHKLGRWLSPWALLCALAGLVMLAPTEPWAQTALAGFAMLALLCGATWVVSGRTVLGRLAAVPGHVAASAVAIALACVQALRITPEFPFPPVRRPELHLRVHA